MLFSLVPVVKMKAVPKIMVQVQLLSSNSVSSNTQVGNSVTDTANPEDLAPVKYLFCSLVPWTGQNAIKNIFDGLISMGHFVSVQKTTHANADRKVKAD